MYSVEKSGLCSRQCIMFSIVSLYCINHGDFLLLWAGGVQVAQMHCVQCTVYTILVQAGVQVAKGYSVHNCLCTLYTVEHCVYVHI